MLQLDSYTSLQFQFLQGIRNAVTSNIAADISGPLRPPPFYFHSANSMPRARWILSPGHALPSSNGGSSLWSLSWHAAYVTRLSFKCIEVLRSVAGDVYAWVMPIDWTWLNTLWPGVSIAIKHVANTPIHRDTARILRNIHIHIYIYRYWQHECIMVKGYCLIFTAHSL